MSIIGLDISHYQGTNINWTKMLSAGVKFIYLKCSEGTFYRDDTFVNNHKKAKEVGIKVGAYHFVRGGDAEGQFQWFKKSMGNLVFDLPPALDVEVYGITEALVHSIGTSLKQLIETKPQQFLYRETMYPAIYTNISLGNSIFKSAKMSNYPLWIATRKLTAPVLPKTWKSVGHFVWQDAVTSGVPYGIKGNVDHNYWGVSHPFPDEEPQPPPPTTKKEFTITIEVSPHKYSNKVLLEKQ